MYDWDGLVKQDKEVVGWWWWNGAENTSRDTNYDYVKHSSEFEFYGGLRSHAMEWHGIDHMIYKVEGLLVRGCIYRYKWFHSVSSNGSLIICEVTEGGEGV